MGASQLWVAPSSSNSPLLLWQHTFFFLLCEEQQESESLLRQTLCSLAAHQCSRTSANIGCMCLFWGFRGWRPQSRLCHRPCCVPSSLPPSLCLLCFQQHWGTCTPALISPIPPPISHHHLSPSSHIHYRAGQLEFAFRLKERGGEQEREWNRGRRRQHMIQRRGEREIDQSVRERE